MRQLTNEIADAHKEKHPDPANLAQGSSDWNFARLVNQKAYDRISLDYEEHYFSQALLTETFDAWLDGTPQAAISWTWGVVTETRSLRACSKRDTGSRARSFPKNAGTRPRELSGRALSSPNAWSM